MNVSSHECRSEIKSQSLRATLAGRNESVVYVYCQFLGDTDHTDAILQLIVEENCRNLSNMNDVCHRQKKRLSRGVIARSRHKSHLARQNEIT